MMGKWSSLCLLIRNFDITGTSMLKDKSIGCWRCKSSLNTGKDGDFRCQLILIARTDEAIEGGSQREGSGRIDGGYYARQRLV